MSCYGSDMIVSYYSCEWQVLRVDVGKELIDFLELSEKTFVVKMITIVTYLGNQVIALRSLRKSSRLTKTRRRRPKWNFFLNYSSDNCLRTMLRARCSVLWNRVS